jgi:hypothetical protein
MEIALKLAASPRSIVPSNNGWAGQVKSIRKKEVSMLETILIILVILWALGFFAFHISSGLIHVLLVIAVVILIVRLLKGRKIF